MDNVNLAIEKYTTHLGLKAIVVIWLYSKNNTHFVMFSNGKRLLIKFVAEEISISTSELSKHIDDFLFVTPQTMVYEKMYYNYLLCNQIEIKKEILDNNFEMLETKMCFSNIYYFNKNRMEKNICFSI